MEIYNIFRYPVKLDANARKLLEGRLNHRAHKEYKEADSIRKELKEKYGIEIIFEDPYEFQIRFINQKSLQKPPQPAKPADSAMIGGDPLYIKDLGELKSSLKNPKRNDAEKRLKRFFKEEYKIESADSIPFLDADEPTIFFSRQLASDDFETRSNRFVSEGYGFPFAASDCSIDSYSTFPYKKNHARNLRILERDEEDDPAEVKSITVAHPVDGEVLNTIRAVDGEPLVEYHKKLFEKGNSGAKIFDLGRMLQEALRQSLDGGYVPPSLWISGDMWTIEDSKNKRAVSEKYNLAGKNYISSSGIYSKGKEEILELAHKGRITPPVEFNYDMGFAMISRSPVIQAENWDGSGRMEELAKKSYDKVLKGTGIKPLVMKYSDIGMHAGLTGKTGSFPNHVIVGDALDSIFIAPSGNFYQDSATAVEAMYNRLFPKHEKLPKK